MDSRRSDKFKKSKAHFLAHKNQKTKGRQMGRKISDQQHRQIDEWNDTKYYFAKNWRKVPKSELYDAMEELELELDLNTEVCENNLGLCKIEITDEDTLTMAHRYVDDDLDPLVLNMASCHKPGGGVASGKSAQEEQIFTRSNAHETHDQKYYPLGNTEMIYSPEVTIIKDTRENNYELLDEEYVIGMVACPALKNPKIHEGQYQSEDERSIMEMKIEHIFMLGILYKHKSLVLGALGCGAYNNPPEEVANIFLKMTNKYKKYFKKIGFAILTIDADKSQNINIFKRVFGIE